MDVAKLFRNVERRKVERMKPVVVETGHGGDRKKRLEMVIIKLCEEEHG